jgi:hypothetical protein
MNAKRIFGTALLAAMIAGAGSAAAADLWLHVKVDGGRKGTEKVEINMPLSMIESFAPMLQGRVRDAGRDGRSQRLRIDDRDYDVAELRRIWRELEDGPDATYITVNEPDSKVRIAKRGSYLVMTAVEREDGENVEARIPIPVVGALLSGRGDGIDVSAALRELARFGEGELMTVTSAEETVRIWIDDDSR